MAMYGAAASTALVNYPSFFAAASEVVFFWTQRVFPPPLMGHEQGVLSLCIRSWAMSKRDSPGGLVGKITSR